MKAGAAALVAVAWVVFGGLFVAHHFRTRRRRGAGSAAARQGELRAPESMAGLLLEGAGIFVLFAWRDGAGERPAWVYAPAVLLAGASTAFAAAALRDLGMQWRIKAVVTEDHRLVTRGTYGVVRHPIYLSLLGMAAATGLVITAWSGLAAGLAVYMAGTEVRVRAEDRILRQRFGAAFEDYRRRVAAYLPFIR